MDNYSARELHKCAEQKAVPTMRATFGRCVTRNGHRLARLAKIAYTGVGNHVIRSGSRDLSALYYASARSCQFCIVALLFLRARLNIVLGIEEVFGKTCACISAVEFNHSLRGIVSR